MNARGRHTCIFATVAVFVGWPPSCLATAQTVFCPSFVTSDVSGVSTDFSHVFLEKGCPDGGKTPQQMHYHLRQTTDTAPAFALSSSEIDIIVPELNADGLKFRVADDWSASSGDVGAEMTFAAGKLKMLDILGVDDQIYLSDEEGSLTTVRDQGVDQLLHWSSVATGDVSFRADGVGSAAVIDAPGASLTVTIQGEDQEVKIISAASITGSISGTGNMLLVVSGSVVSLQMNGVGNEVIIGPADACANVDQKGVNNNCTDSSTETANLTSLECVGPSGASNCDSIALSSGNAPVLIISVASIGLISGLAWMLL